MVRFRVAVVLAALAAAVIGIAPPAGAAGPTVAGGDTLTGVGGTRCTVGVNVTGRGILAGRCGPVGTQWSIGATPVGPVVTVFASGLTLISITDPAVIQLPGLRNGVAITGAANSFVGQSVRELSPVSGVHTGTVTALNATVVFPQGTVTGLVRSTLCPDAGGSGTPIYAGTSILSLVVGGSGNCTSGGTTFSQPVTQLLAITGRAVF
jgi:streptogrisin B